MRSLCNSGPKVHLPFSPYWTEWAPTPATTSCASPKRGTPHAQPMDHDDPLDERRFPVPLVDRTRPVGVVAGAGELGVSASSWGKSQGGHPGRRPGSDQSALHQALLPDLKRAGVKAMVQTIAADPSESAMTTSEAPLILQKFRQAGVTSLIPLIPFNVFFPVLQDQTQQQYFPKLLLSDYESSLESSLGLIPVPYKQALNGQEGVTTYTLGGSTTPARSPRVATTRGCGPAGTSGTRPIPASPRAT